MRAVVNPDRYVEAADRLWSKVNKTENCWLWTGSKTAKGYGRFHFGLRNQVVRAHRFVYILMFGSIPETQQVRHTCDNPPCVRPDHLVLGTAQHNSNDRVQRARAPRGEHASWSKLTTEQVLAIRADRRPQRLIGADYGICQQSVSLIKKGINWSHV